MWLWLACTPDSSLIPPRDEVSDPLPSTSPPVDPPPETIVSCETVAQEERAYLPQGSSAAETLLPCTTTTHPSSGAAGSVLTVSIAGASVTVTDFTGETLAGPGNTGTFDVSILRSGEIFVSLEAAVDAGLYELSIDCTEGCDREWTRYPLLLMHGLGGADAFDGVEYFYEIPSGLSAMGVAVSAQSVSPFAVPTDRALEWEVYLDGLLAMGHRRVNLFGHSLGGTDARVLASPGGLDRGDVIASVTTLGTPHAGSEIADLLRDGFEAGVLDPALFDIGASVFGLLFGIDASDPAFAETIEALSAEGAADIDAAHPDHPDTLYWSWAGRSCGVLEPWCQDDHGGEIVDPLLAASYLLIWPTPNDGFVAVDSQLHGSFLGEVSADHSDEIGQFQDGDNPAFDHRQFYLDEVRRLRAAGL